MKTITYDDTLYQLVPKEPTAEILSAMGDVDGTPDRLLRLMYLEGLSAAPTPPAQPEAMRVPQTHRSRKSNGLSTTARSSVD